VSAWRTFVLDLFTRHLGTKFLSLILSIVLFAFVLQTLSDEREVPLLRLSFAIEDELGRRFVVMTPTIELRKLVIRGVRAKVEDVEQQFKQNRVVEIRINEEFLRRYSTDVSGRTGVRISINRDFFRQLQILRQGVELRDEISPAPLLELEPRGLVKLNVTLHPDYRQNTQLDADVPYEAKGGGRQVTVFFRPATIEVSGPARNLPEGPATLQVEIESATSTLYFRRPGPGTTSVAGKVTRVDWTASGFKGDPALLTVLGLPRPRADALASQLEFGFEVQPQRDTRDAEKLPLFVVFAGSQLQPDFLASHRAEGIGFGISMEQIRTGICPLIKISGPKSLMTEEVLADLELVVDLGHATRRDEAVLEAPVFLRLRDEAKHVDAHLILQLLSPGNPNDPDPPFVRFTKTKE